MLRVAYLSIGSNEGDRLENISKSIQLINKLLGEIISLSSIYENPPLGFEAELNFYNLCIAINTSLNPFELLDQLKNIEKEIGRKSKSHEGVYTSRCIDIDILFFEETIIDSIELSIPHMHLNNRRFVLEPMNEISGEFIDPRTGFPISILLEQCEDKSQLIKLPIYIEYK
jgi:deoxyguanosine kinase